MSLSLGSLLLLGAAGSLAGYLNRLGLDRYCGYLLVVAALTAVLLGSGLLRRPPRWRAARRVAAVIALADLFAGSWVFWFAPGVHGGEASGYLQAANWLLVLATPAAIAAGLPRPATGRPGPSSRAGQEA